MPDNLVILESPSKIKSVGKFLGWNFTIKASLGHVRFLPEDNLSVDINNNFEPKFKIIPDKLELINELRSISREYKEIYLATDPDREGEGIAWHLSIVLYNKFEFKRIPLGEITKNSIILAFKNPQFLDKYKIDSYKARRVLDRLIGYRISQWLYRQMSIKKPNIGSGGRVQSPALKILCDREEEILKFKPIIFWILSADLQKQHTSEVFSAELVGTIPDKVFKVKKNKNLPQFYVTNTEDLNLIILDLKKRDYIVHDVKINSYTEPPPLPFTTDSLIKEASEKFGFEPSKVMKIAQKLYEGPSPDNLTKEECQLYELIWKRFVASQMTEAKYKSKKIIVHALHLNSEMKQDNNRNVNRYIFFSETKKTTFEGFKEVYGKKSSRNFSLPEVNINEQLDLMKINSFKDKTTPPRRFTKATLIEGLKNKGIGRPSTYSKIADVLIDHKQVKYLNGKNKKGFLRPTSFGFKIIEKLKSGYPKLIDFEFTKRLEENLDKIESGKLDWHEFVKKEYYYWIKKKPTKFCKDCGAEMYLWNRNGKKFWGCSNYPKCRYVEPYKENSICPNPKCGKKLKSNWNFCPYCKTKL